MPQLMSPARVDAQPASNFNFYNVVAALFKHKKKILACAVAGLIAAAAVYFLYPPSYESDAKLLVRYVLERSGFDPVETTTGNSARGAGGSLNIDGVIAAEVSILTSWDLAVQTAEALGPNKVMPDAKSPTVAQAAGSIQSGLTTTTAKGSNIIAVGYQNRRPEVATAVLNELVSRYFIKHLEVHRSAGAFDFVSQQTDQVRARLNQTEESLKQLKSKLGIFDLKDSVSAFNSEVAKITDQLSTADGDLAEQTAKIKLMEGAASPGSAFPGPTATSATAQASPSAVENASPPTPPPKDVQDYQSALVRLADLKKAEPELLSKYTEASSQVRSLRAQIEEVNSQKTRLEKRFPSLAAMASKGPQDLAGERAGVAGLQAKTEALKRLLVGLLERRKQLADAAPEINRLERTRELEEASYKYFQGSLEKARIDEALDPSKMPNISAVQRPSPAGRVTKTRDKIALGLAGGGILLGLLLGLGPELLLNRAIKRPVELERQLQAPVFLTIPFTATNGKLPLRDKKRAEGKGTATKDNHVEIAPWEDGHFIKKYAAAIRDRLTLHFELNGISHKPKLVGVTGLSAGSGTSTLAAGLAAALSETGEGKVLFVDANVANGKAEPFLAGRPATPLTTAIRDGAAPAEATENLYLATIASPNAHPAQVGLKRFFALMPNLKASDFDYVIFDLPPLNQTSPTIGLAGLMDKILLIVEAETNSSEVVKRNYRDLVSARADVAVILNKVRSRVPKWLDQQS